MAGRRSASSSDNGPLDKAEIRRLSDDVASGTATPAAARKLLEEFVRWHQLGAIPPARLIEHVADCIAALLDGKRKLRATADAPKSRNPTVTVRTCEQAFGLVRIARGNPRIDYDTRCDVAFAVLMRMLDGSSFQSATSDIAEYRHAKGLPISSDTQVRAVWAELRREALDEYEDYVAMSEIAYDQDPVTDSHLTCLRKIYRNVSGARFRGESL
jgi:hypothetical protein